VSGSLSGSSRFGSSAAAGLALVGVLFIWTGLASPSAGDEVTVGVRPARSESAQAPPAHGKASRDTLRLYTSRQGTARGSAEASEVGSARPSTPAREPDVRDSVSGPVLPESDPVSVSIPTLGVKSRLLELGLDENKAMEVPRDPDRAGWFSRGPAPGALGPAVIAGHVTWDGAPGVFYRLTTLRRGDQVAVTRSDGRTAVFTVDRVARFSKSEFPTQAVYGAIDHAGLRLITCGGTYDESEHRYLDNVVVFARASAVRRA
jgi:sortase (surface protein transpeptidase)